MLCCMFLPVCRCNGEVDLGSKALDDVLYRAQLELFPEALLVREIIRHYVGLGVFVLQSM